MDTITDINKSSLAGLLAALATAKMKVGSIANADGSYTVTYEPLPSASDGAQLSETMPSTPPVANMDSPAPAPAGAHGPFVHARAIAPKTILYTDADGRDEIREGGSRSWRNCNAGNIRKGDFSINCGAIGDDGSFAIFPDEESGKAAIIALLRTTAYIKLTLKQAIFRYAPPNENQSEDYAKFIRDKTGIALTAVLADLKMDDFRKIAKFIQVVEGWKPGTIRPNGPPAPLIGAGAAIGVASSAASATQDWMAIARREAALPAHERSQWPDPGENPRILNYFKVCAHGSRLMVATKSIGAPPSSTTALSRVGTWAPTIQAPAPSSGTRRSSFMSFKPRNQARSRFAATPPSPTRAGQRETAMSASWSPGPARR